MRPPTDRNMFYIRVDQAPSMSPREYMLDGNGFGSGYEAADSIFRTGASGNGYGSSRSHSTGDPTTRGKALALLKLQPRRRRRRISRRR